MLEAGSMEPEVNPDFVLLLVFHIYDHLKI